MKPIHDTAKVPFPARRIRAARHEKSSAPRDGGRAGKALFPGWALLALLLLQTGCGGGGSGRETAGRTKTVTLPGGAKMEMVWCPPGTFMMGSPEDEEGRSHGETLHQVTLTNGFWLAKHEVTQKQWRSVMGDNPSLFDDDGDKPVERVSLERCREFCRMAGLVLPTEAQWEYACRAGSGGAYGGNGDIDAMGWHDGNSDGETHPVGKKAANAWGFHDMHGNVGEFCADGYETYPSVAVTNPVGRPSILGTVVRGGSWESDAGDCRSARRDSMALASIGNERLGFRPACENLETALEKAGMPGKEAVAGQTEVRDVPGLAETEGTGRKMALAGMFGVRFGKAMAESERCMTNNAAGNLFYEYAPESPLDGFDAYALFATPESRQVFQIRAVWMGGIGKALREMDEKIGKSMFDDEEWERLYGGSGGATEKNAEQVFEETVRLLERRFKQAGKPWGEEDKRHFVFANGNIVIVAKREDQVFIDAVDTGLQDAAGREFAEMTARQFAGDLRVLALQPEKDGGEPLSRIDSVFGVAFGETCRWGRNPVENNTRAWAYKLDPDGPFMGCSDFLVFATAQSRSVFMVRAVFEGDSDAEAQDAFDRMRRLLEHATGGTFRDGESDGKDKMCRMEVGDRFGIDLAKNWESDLVLLDFWDREGFGRNEHEAAAKATDETFAPLYEAMEALQAGQAARKRGHE